MRRIGRWTLAATGTLVLLVVAGLLALPWLVNLSRVRGLVGNIAAQSLGRPVRIAAVGVRGLPTPRVVLQDVEVADDPALGRGPLLAVPRLEIRLRLRPLLALRLQPAEVVLERPVLTLVRRADGQWNVSGVGTHHEPRPGRASRGTGGEGPAIAVPVSRGRIEHGTVIVDLPRSGATHRYRLEDLRGRLSGTGTTAEFELTGRLEPGGLALRVAGGRLSLDGARTLADAPIQADVHVDGADVAPLVATLAGPAAGVVDGTIHAALTLSGTLARPRLAGVVESPRVTVTRTAPRCPEPRRRSLVLEAVQLEPRIEDGLLRVPVVRGRLGNGRIVASMTAALGGSGAVEVTALTVEALSLQTVLADFLCERYAVTGPLDLTGRARFRAGAPWTTLQGHGQFRIGAGRVVGSDALRLAESLLEGAGLVAVGLDAEVPGVLRSSPLEFDSINATYRIADGVAETRDLLYASRGARARVAGRYALDTGAVNADVVVEHRRGAVHARVTGTAAAPVVQVSPAALLQAVDRPTVERGLRELLRRVR